MDKPNLYYIVIEGTNNCALTESKEPLIILPEFVDALVYTANQGKQGDNYIKMTIEEFERTFTESEQW
jgi:hypothetical protein